MKTTSRKRLLVSSVAMLLVAMLALGTATYAWFTSNTTATASGINVKTIKSSELQISKSDKAWGTQIDYGVANKTFIPASTANGTAWFTANAEDRTSFEKPVDEQFSSITDGANYYFAEQLNVRNAGQADVENVTISISGINNDYIRVAVVEANDSGLGTGDFTTSVYDNAGAAYDAASAADSTTEITPSTNYTINVGTLAGGETADAGEAKYYNIYVWFEGQDQQCVDSNAGQIVENIEFTVTGDTVDQLG